MISAQRAQVLPLARTFFPPPTALVVCEPEPPDPDAALVTLARATARVQTESQWHRLVEGRVLDLLNAEGLVYGWGELSRSSFRLRECHLAGRASESALTRPEWEALLARAMRAWYHRRAPVHADWARAVEDLIAQRRGLPAGPAFRTLTVTAVKSPNTSTAGFFGFINLDTGRALVLEDLQIIAPLLWQSGLRARHSDRRAGEEGQALAMTPREQEIMQWIARGKSDAQIAALLNRSLHTVRNQVRKILGKLGTTSRISAVLRAHQRNLLSIDSILGDERHGQTPDAPPASSKPPRRDDC